MVLVDTSIWIDHLRQPVEGLVSLLEAGQVMTHPFILGELACGTLNERQAFLYSLGRLPLVPVATDAEVLAFIESVSLMGKGVGYLDMHLLASIRLQADVSFWTRDRKLAALASDFVLTH